MTSSEILNKECPISKVPEISLKEQIILKNEIGVLPMWFGKVLWNDSDYETFDRILNRGRQFNMYFPFVIPDADEIIDAKLQSLKLLAMDLQTTLNKIQHPLIIFAVSTAQSAERPWLDQFPQRLSEYRQQTNHTGDTFVYKIIIGGRFSNLNTEKNPHGQAWPQELRAHELNGVYLHFDTDAPTAGFERLVDFMNRVVGVDLPAEEFPNYCTDEVRRIAWHINRESFNAFSEKVGSIPKYTIGSNGRPIFPF
jgi:hypothetical protein